MNLVRGRVEIGGAKVTVSERSSVELFGETILSQQETGRGIDLDVRNNTLRPFALQSSDSFLGFLA